MYKNTRHFVILINMNNSYDRMIDQQTPAIILFCFGNSNLYVVKYYFTNQKYI